MGQFIDLTGQRFNRLTVLGFDCIRNRKTYWKCRCDCGKECSIRSDSMRSGHATSCGCYHEERNRAKRGGTSNDRLYMVWAAMKRRCYNKNAKEYPNYGGRGIRVCDEWKNSYSSFEKWSLDNGYDKDSPYGATTIDRIDVNGNYCPENCRYISMKEQASNKQDTVRITVNGITKTAKEWADITGVKYGTIIWRLNHGISHDDAILPKLKERRRYAKY